MTVTASSLQNPDIYTDPNKAPEFQVALQNQQQPESNSAKSTPPQTLSDILEIDGDGDLSQFEINTWREIAQGDIEKLSAGNPDASQKETIARFKEFLVHLEKHFPEIDSQDVLLRDFDTDQNGSLSKDEIAQGKTFLQQQIDTWVNAGADKTLYVHAQQLMAALNALEHEAPETAEDLESLGGEDISTGIEQPEEGYVIVENDEAFAETTPTDDVVYGTLPEGTEEGYTVVSEEPADIQEDAQLDAEFEAVDAGYAVEAKEPVIPAEEPTATTDAETDDAGYVVVAGEPTSFTGEETLELKEDGSFTVAGSQHPLLPRQSATLPQKGAEKFTQTQTLSDILEIDGDGVLSQYEIDTWREIAQGDVEKLSAGNPTPEQQYTIDRFKEFLVHLEKHFPEIDSQDVLLRDFDTDQNGSLSKEEIAQAKSFLQQQIDMWVNTGADKTLYVHAQQLIAALDRASSEDQVEDTGTDLIGKYDTNGDGVLSSAEITAAKAVLKSFIEDKIRDLVALQELETEGQYEEARLAS